MPEWWHSLIYGAEEGSCCRQNFSHPVKHKLVKPEIPQDLIKEKPPNGWKIEFPHRFPCSYAYQFVRNQEQIFHIVIKGSEWKLHTHTKSPLKLIMESTIVNKLLLICSSKTKQVLEWSDFFPRKEIMFHLYFPHSCLTCEASVPCIAQE